MAKALQLYLNNPELFMTSEAEEEVASEIAQVLQLDQEREDEAFKHVRELFSTAAIKDSRLKSAKNALND
jgi:hypothetical protein